MLELAVFVSRSTKWVYLNHRCCLVKFDDLVWHVFSPRRTD